MRSFLFLLTVFSAGLAILQPLAVAAGDATPASCTEKWASDVRKNLDSVRALHLKFRPDVVAVQSNALNDAIQGVQSICAQYEKAKTDFSGSLTTAKNANIQQCEGLVLAAKGYGKAWGTYSDLFGTAWSANRDHYDAAYKLQQWDDKVVYSKQAEIDQAARVPGTWQKVKAEIKRIFDLTQLNRQERASGTGNGLVRNRLLAGAVENTPFKQTQAAYQELEDYFYGKSVAMEAAYMEVLDKVQSSGSLCSPKQYDEVQSIYEKMNPKGVTDDSEN